MKENSTLNTIESAIADIKAGKVIIVVDDENRENEGDFLAAATNSLKLLNGVFTLAPIIEGVEVIIETGSNASHVISILPVK